MNDEIRGGMYVVGSVGVTYYVSCAYEGCVNLHPSHGGGHAETVQNIRRFFRMATSEEIAEFERSKAAWKRDAAAYLVQQKRAWAKELFEHVRVVRECFDAMDEGSLTQLVLDGNVNWAGECKALAGLLREEDTDE